MRKAPWLFLGDEHLVGDRIEDEGGDKLALALQRDGDGELRNAVQEIRGAVDGIDDEAVRLVLAFDGARLFDQKAITGPRLAQLLDENAFGALVGGGDEIGGAFARHLQIFQLAEIADQPLCRPCARPRP